MAWHSAVRGGLHARAATGSTPPGTTATCCRKATAFSRFSHFIIPLVGLFVAVRLLFDPFVRARPFVFTVSIVGALSCLYIAGEEMSWGQHFFHWNTPEYWAEVNRQEETNLHNTYAIFEKTPRSILELSALPSAASACRSPPSSIRGCAPAARRCSCRRTRWCRWRSGRCSSRSWIGWSKAHHVGKLLRPAERDDRDLSLCLHRRLSRHLRAADQGARSGARPSAEVTSSVVQQL